ncbi:MAG: hypothetical protein AB1393_14010 [Candidatus Edwardsbacteria bacterium]
MATVTVGVAGNSAILKMDAVEIKVAAGEQRLAAQVLIPVRCNVVEAKEGLKIAARVGAGNVVELAQWLKDTLASLEQRVVAVKSAATDPLLRREAAQTLAALRIARMVVPDRIFGGDREEIED